MSDYQAEIAATLFWLAVAIVAVIAATVWWVRDLARLGKTSPHEAADAQALSDGEAALGAREQPEVEGGKP